MSINKRFAHVVILMVLMVLMFIFIILNTGYSYRDEIISMGYGNPEVLRKYHTDKITNTFICPTGEFVQIVQTKGYHDGLVFAVVIKGNEIADVVILAHNESKDYGEHVTKQWFLDRLKLKTDELLNIAILSKEKENDVVAITGATITSQAVVVGVNDCIINYRRYLNEK